MQLGPLEAKVLAVLAETDEASVRNVQMRITKERKVAYTTVATTLDRLHGKGMVKRRKIRAKGGTQYLYGKLRNERLSRRLVRSTIERLVTAFGPSAIPAIVDTADRLREEPERDSDEV